MKYSVIERTLPAENNTAEVIMQAGEAGFDGITLQVNGPVPSEHMAWSAEGRSKIRRAAVEAGIEISTVCPAFFWQGWEEQDGLISDNMYRRERTIDVLEHLIDAAGAVGADIVLLNFFDVNEITEEKHKQRVIDALNEVVETAELVDIVLTLETSLPARENAEIVDAVDSEAVKICYDAANKVALCGFDAVEEIDVLGDSIGEYHVKDFHEPPPPFPENYARLGEGAVDQEAVAGALKGIGYDGWVVLETEFDVPLEYTMDELAFTKDLFEN